MSAPISKTKAAEGVLLRVRQLRKDAELAKAGILSGDYSRVVYFPEFAIRFKAETDSLATSGYTADILGPLIVSEYIPDPTKSWETDYAPQYEAFKTALQNLTGFILTNQATLLRQSFDSTGQRHYNVDPGQAITDQINTLLDAVLAQLAGV